MTSQTQDLTISDLSVDAQRLTNTISFDYLEKTDVKVEVGTTVSNRQEKTYETEWTITSDNKVQINASVFNSTTGTYKIKIYRQTNPTPAVTFQNGGVIRATDLNRSNKQALFVAEEIRETLNNLALGANPNGDQVLISNSNISSNAQIDGTKISPNFGSQNIVTTGAINASQPSCLLTHPPDTALAHVSSSNTSNGVPITHQNVRHNVGPLNQLCVVTANNSRIQVKVAGTYLVSSLTSGVVQNTPDPSDAVGFVLLKNGSIYDSEQIYAQKNFGAVTGEEYFMSFCFPIVLAVDDYLEVAYQNINGSTALLKKGHFSVTKLN